MLLASEAAEQGSPEWYAARLGRATASRFADAMAFLRDGKEAAARAAYRTELVCERITGRRSDSFQSAAMKRGVELEPEARSAFEAYHGKYVEQVGFVRHPELMAGCSPDGIADGLGLEIKCPLPHTHLSYLRKKALPEEYFWQVHGGMWITGAKGWYFVSYCPEFPAEIQLFTLIVPRDEKIIEQIDAGIRKFLASVDAEEAEVRAIMAERSFGD